MKRRLLIQFRCEKTQAEIAKEFGVSQQAWASWENGTSQPSVILMKKLEDAIGVPMEEIFFDVFNRDNQSNQKVQQDNKKTFSESKVSQ